MAERVTIRKDEVIPMIAALNMVPADQWNEHIDRVLERLYEVQIVEWIE